MSETRRELHQEFVTAVIALPTWEERRAVMQSHYFLCLVSHHEAAHAVVHLLQGQRTFSATLDLWEVDQRQRVMGDADGVSGFALMNDKDKFGLIVSLYAPYAWEIQADIRPRNRDRSNRDHQRIRALAVRITSEAMPDYKPGDSEWNVCLFRVLLSARRRARNLLRDAVTATMIRRVAMELEEYGTLFESQLLDLLSSLSDVRFPMNRTSERV